MQIRQDDNIIVKADEIRHGLVKRTIYGLNIFSRNHVAVPTLQDPRFLFLKSVTDAIRCSAHVGAIALSDRVDTPEELFGAPKDDMAYSRATVEYHDGFFDAPFASETQWLRETTRIYPLVLVVSHDGDCFHAYARQTARFPLPGRALLKTAEYMRSSNWFQHNQTSLSWNDEKMCLTPALIM